MQKVKSNSRILIISLASLFFCTVLAIVMIINISSKIDASVVEPADINSDGNVNIFDLSTLLSNWNHTGANLSDVNNDGIVNVYDLSFLISKWGVVVSASPYLYRQGSTLMLSGVTYKVAGLNAYGLTGCENGPGYYTANDLDGFFASLPPNTMVRTWATSRMTIADLDLVVAKAAAHNQMLIFSLADGANNCNANNEQYNRAWYQSGYSGAYFSWINTIVPRYKNSPAIGMWEIANEPGWGCATGDCGATTTEMKNFFDNSAALIKSLDSNHLVESGAMGKDVAAMNTQATFANVHSGPNIDVTSIHEYEYEYNGNTGAQSWYPTAKSASDSINKPIIIGETGAPLSQPGNTTCRDSNMTIQHLLQLKYDSYFAGGASGVFAWNWMKSKPSWVADGCSSGQHFFYGTNNPVISLLYNY